MSKYIVYDGNDYEQFDTELEAMNYANECIENCLNGDGWYEEVENIYIAKVIAVTEKYNVKYRKDLDDEITKDWAPEWDYTCKYRLKNV